MRLSRPTVAAAAGLLLTALVSGGAAAQTTAPPPGPRLERPLVVVSAPDAAGWVRLLRSSGAAARLGTFDEAMNRPAAVITAAVKLSADQLRTVRDAVT